MTQKIRCTNPNCANRILPTTAKRNGGLCGQCANEKARQQYLEEVRKNRRDLNEFAGLNDPVEILKIIHKPRKYDPLINWIPYPIKTDELYVTLGKPEQAAMAEYALQHIGTDRHGEAEKVCLCLAAFTDANIDACLRKLVSIDSVRPGFPFFKAPSDVRDELLDRVCSDDTNRHSILLALAWIGDEKVVQHFSTWRNSPPVWANTLGCPPSNYAHEAGWELSDDGNRRNLYSRGCIPLLKRPDTDSSCLTLTDRTDLCPWCQTPLTNFLDASPDTCSISGEPAWGGRLQIATCEHCTVFFDVFGQLDENGICHWSSWNPKEQIPPNWEAERLPRNPLAAIGTRRAWFAAHDCLPTTFSQIGGHPTWIGEASYPTCPECARTMTFVAQIAPAEIMEPAEGIFYSFACSNCRTTATNFRQT